MRSRDRPAMTSEQISTWKPVAFRVTLFEPSISNKDHSDTVTKSTPWCHHGRCSGSTTRASIMAGAGEVNCRPRAGAYESRHGR